MGFRLDSPYTVMLPNDARSLNQPNPPATACISLAETVKECGQNSALMRGITYCNLDIIVNALKLNLDTPSWV